MFEDVSVCKRKGVLEGESWRMACMEVGWLASVKRVLGRKAVD
jgi:hypothetical protein